MGNILTSTQGSTLDKLKTNNELTSFAKNINDYLLELDLYSVDPKTGTPRGNFEVDYTSTGLSSRPKDSNNKLVDVNGIPYSVSNDKEFNLQEPAKPTNTNTSDSTYWQNTSKYYNFKRGICNGTTKVPVNTAGVMLPADWNSDNPSTRTKALQSCLIDGTTTGSTLTEATTAGAAPIVSIPDIDKTKDTLNSDSNGLTNQTVYGKPMSEDCKNLLNGMLTNSYIVADINKYTKLPSMLHPSAGGGAVFDGTQYLFTDKNNKIMITSKAIAADQAITGTDKFPQSYFTKQSNLNTNQLATVSYANDVGGNCGTFYTEMCDYYYYNDYIDGVTYNPTLLKNLPSSAQGGFTTNITYLTQHIPDCRCANNFNIQNNVQMPGAGGTPPIEYYYITNRCKLDGQNIREYGTTSITSNVTLQSLFNWFNPGSSAHPIPNTTKGFGAQVDPADPSVITTNMGNSDFIYAAGARGSTNTFNSYVCNMAQTFNLVGNGGNVTVAGVSMNCSFPNSTPPPTGGTSGSGTSSPPPSAPKNKPTLSVTINTPPVNLNDYTKSVDPFYQLTALITNLNSAYNFYTGNNPNYGFAFQSVNNPSSVLFGNYTCGSITNPGNTAALCNSTQSYTPIYNIKTPFIYGKTTNEYGINYNLFIQNLPGNNTNEITPSTPIPILLKQYAMQITDVIPGDFGLSLRFNIKFNCISRPIISYVIILTPVAPSTVNVPVVLKGTDFFTDVINKKGFITGQSEPPINSSLADGFLLIGPNGQGTSPIQAIKYTYKILLNPTESNSSASQVTYTGGDVMNFSSNVPSNYSGTNNAIDFGNFVSAFYNTTISYLDTNNNYNYTLFPSSNPIATFGSLLKLTWSFTNKDKYTGFNIKYTVDSSTTPVQLGQVGISTLEYKFMMPITMTGQKISFYIEAYGSTITPPKENFKSNILTITSTPVPTSPAVFNGFNIIKDSTVTNLKPFDNKNIEFIPAYLNLSTDEPIPDGNDVIVYDYISNQWSTGKVSTPSTTPSTTIVFQLPTNIPTMTFTLTNNKSDGTSTVISTGTKIQIGALLTITWTLPTAFTDDTNVQIILYDVVYDTFTISKGIKTGTYQFTLYDLTGGLSNNTTTLKLKYLRTTIPGIGLTVENPFINTTTNPSTSANSLTLSSVNPLVYISPNSTNKNSINNINLTLTNPLNDNVYFTVFNGYESPLSINTSTMTLQKVDYSKPIKLNITSSSIGNFTNVIYGNLRKSKKEHFGNITKKNLIEGLTGNTLIQNVLRLDLSQTNFTNSAIVNYIFNNYSSVSIQSLELYFGTKNIDNSTLNISFAGNSSPSIEIGSVRIIGIMTGKIFFPIPIPGATAYYYSTNTPGANGSWASSFTLNNNNDGYFSISSSDSNAVSDANNLALNPSTATGSSDNILGLSSTDNSEGTNWLLYGGIALVLIILAVVIYFMFFTKTKKK